MAEALAPGTTGGRMAYRIEVSGRDAAYDTAGAAVCAELRSYGVEDVASVRSVQVYVLAGDFSPREAEWLAREFLVDEVLEMFSVNAPVLPANRQLDTIVEIVRRPGVMDPAEAAIRKGILLLGKRPYWLRTSRKFIVRGGKAEQIEAAARKILANEIIEHVIVGRDARLTPPSSQSYEFSRQEVPLRALRAEDLLDLSRQNMLSLNLEEMKAIQAYFQRLGRDPTDVELETIAQTWSEHCVHKTFRGRIRYREEGKAEEVIDNLLKSTVMRVTQELQRDWCWSVFADNAGVIALDDEWGAVFKVETHNHPSALEPYGGAGTGVGGVIRDILGTGLGAKPVLNTDVFCFGLPDMPAAEVPRGALHPLRVLRGVVAGVRDYGNRMGIPTANGAIYFDRRYTGNPLVFCGNVGIIPRRYAQKRRPAPGQIALLVGGRTGRDGIHGATFSSAVLNDSSESLSSGAVQIGNPIEEKKVLDFLLRCRAAELYTCITDCGAGGLSSALGEMGGECGVEAWLEKVPLKYAGLSYTEIWISEAQERMVIAADGDKLPEIMRLAQEEDVEVTEIGRFTGDGRLRLLYNGVEVGCLEMEFLHRGLPQSEREAVWKAIVHPEPALSPQDNYGAELRAILSAWNVCSKEWVIRQYDHEVQGHSVLKPLVGVCHDGPGDAAVIAPLLGSRRALIVACGMNPRYSDIDPYHMAAAAIDEALRNVVAVGGNLERCALLDNFCWGNCDKPDRLGGLVRAAKACYDIASAYGLPFISGKDSLNNEFVWGRETLAIPGTLLISALAVMPDAAAAVSMDAKAAGDLIYAVGLTRREMGGSHFYALHNAIGSSVPQVDPEHGRRVFAGIAALSAAGLARAIHDCAEGGLAVAAAEMALAGGLGMDLDLGLAPQEGCAGDAAALLFSESQSRFLVEIRPADAAAAEERLRAAGAPFGRLGAVTGGDKLTLRLGEKAVVSELLSELKEAWQSPLRLAGG